MNDMLKKSNIIHFSDVTLLFAQWIIFKNLVYSFVLEYMNFNLATMAFYTSYNNVINAHSF